MAGQSTAVPEIGTKEFFGKFLRKARKLRCQSIYQLSENAQVDTGYISRLENAHKNPLSPRLLQRFSEALNIPKWLLMAAAGHIQLDEAGIPYTAGALIFTLERTIYPNQ